jgi:hypothetical protein
MPTLREVQDGFRAAILDGAEHGVATAVCGDGLGASARLAVYRHHVFTSLTAALDSTYPVVARLVDPRFFRYAADQLIRRHPPAGPCLFEFGSALADFLTAFPPTRHLAYLPDVARLEWAMNVAAHAPDTGPLAPEALRALAALALHPSVTLLESPWPIDAIWRANQPDAPDPSVDLDAGGVRLQVWRADDEVVFRRLSVAGFACRHALARTGQLEAGVEAALGVDASVDLPALLRGLLDEQVLIARP